MKQSEQNSCDYKLPREDLNRDVDILAGNTFTRKIPKTCWKYIAVGSKSTDLQKSVPADNFRNYSINQHNS